MLFFFLPYSARVQPPILWIYGGVCCLCLCPVFALCDIGGVVMVFLPPCHRANSCSRFTTLTPPHFSNCSLTPCVSVVFCHGLSSEELLVKRFATLLFCNGSLSKREKRLTMHHDTWYPCHRFLCSYCLLIGLERTDSYGII